MHTRLHRAARRARRAGAHRRITARSVIWGGCAAVFAVTPAAAQPEAPAAVPPPRPAIGGTLPPPTTPGGFPTPGGPGAQLSPESRLRLGGPGFPFDSVIAPAPPGAPVRAWSVTPSIAIEQIYNDNIFNTARNREEDLITRVTPALLLGVDTQRLQGRLNYAPGFDYYWRNTSQNRIRQQGNGQVQGVVVPDLFFVDARAAASVQSLSGGFAPGTDPAVGRDNEVQTLTFSVSPYLVQRFRGLATARLGYVYTYVDQDRVDRTAPLPAGQPGSSFTPSEYSSHQGYLVVRSGEDFGRLAMQATLSGTSFVGSGLYEDAYKNIGVLETRYAFTRMVAGLVELGYESQHFNTVPETNVDDVVWAIGTRLTPGPESVIIAKYGRRDGFNSFFLDGTLALGVRTRLSANYAERLTSSALEAGDLLSTVTLDPLGNPVDALTGVPVLPGFANSALGVQSGLFRQKSASATITQVWARDTFSFTVSQTDRTPVADAPGARTRGFSQKGTSFSLRWARDLAETTRLTSFVQYGITTSGVANESDTYSAGLVLAHQINPALTGTLSYRLSIREGGTSAGGRPQADDRTVQNVITAGIRQSF
jgi:uncharacterized protein (PEP-CTERM system associated)